MSDYRMYIAAIKLPPGKLAAQVGHAVLNCYRIGCGNIRNHGKMEQWLKGDERGDGGVQAKIVLRLEDSIAAEMIKAYCDSGGIPFATVFDAGRTVVEPGTLTAIAWGPVLENEWGPWKEMRLY